VHGATAPGAALGFDAGAAAASLVPTLRGIRILVVDDDGDALALLREILETTGAEVATADSAKSALLYFETVRPDVLIADLGMPEMDGFELISRLRRARNAAVRDVPAAALTAYARSEDRAKALRTGFRCIWPSRSIPASSWPPSPRSRDAIARISLSLGKVEDAEAAVPGPLNATHLCIGDGAFRVNVEEDFGELAALLPGEAASDGLAIADVQRFDLDNEHVEMRLVRERAPSAVARREPALERVDGQQIVVGRRGTACHAVIVRRWPARRAAARERECGADNGDSDA
jgi:CheY-like chemotaxis protein